MKSPRPLWCAALVVGLALLVHLPAATAEFTYDDFDFVRGNASLGSLPSALQAWLRPFPPEQPERGLFRPLTALSYALDIAIAGPSPHALHTSNLLLYAVCSLLVLYTSQLLLGSWSLATLAALVFALHPVHCEAVDSVSGRGELLALSFGLCALAAFLRRAPALSLLAYACALFAKETGIMALAVIGAWCAIEHGFERRAVVRAWLRLWPWLVVTVCYLGLRALALGGGLTPQSTYVGGAPWLTRVWTFGRVLVEYMRLLIAPLLLQPDAYYERHVGVQYAPSAEAWLGLLLLGLLLASLASLARRIAQHRDPLLASACLGVASFLLFLVPVSHLIPFGALMAERFLFAPSFGFALALAALLGMALPRMQSFLRAGVLCVLSVWMVGLGLRSHARAGDWQDSVALWTSTAALLPDDYRVQNNLARGYLERGDVERAIPWLERSLRLKPDHPPTLNNLGYAYRKRGDLIRAEQTFTQLVRIAPQHAGGWYNLASLAAMRGELMTAVADYEHALRANPNYALAQRDLAQVQQLLARARRTVAESGPVLAQSDRARLSQLGAACRALGDAVCVQAVQQREQALPP